MNGMKGKEIRKGEKGNENENGKGKERKGKGLDVLGCTMHALKQKRMRILCNRKF